MPRGTCAAAAAAALLLQGSGFLQVASAQGTAVVSNLQELQKEAPLSVAQKESADSQSTARMSSEAAEIVGGITEGFLGKNKISSKELSCLSNGAGTLAAAVTQSCRDAVSAYHDAQAPVNSPLNSPLSTSAPLNSLTPVNGTSQQPSPSLQPRAFQYQGASATPPAVAPTGGEQTVLTLEFAARFAGILALEKQLAQECLRPDAVETFVRAEKHMRNATYVGGHLIANGVDILKELTDATAAYDAGKLLEFGQDLGSAWRKVLLSEKAYTDFKMPSAEGLDEMTRGLVASLFGSGMTLQVMTDAQTSPQLRGSGGWNGVAPPMLGQPGSAYPVPTASQPSVDIDLRNCLVANTPLFRSAWAPVWRLFIDASSKDAPESALKGSSELLTSMFDLQVALRTCGLGPEQEAMLIDAMDAGSARAKLNLPGVHSMTPQQEREDLSTAFAMALEDWKEHSWSAFGAELGSILRDMIVVAFPQKYSIDDAGRLRSMLQLTERRGSSGMMRQPGFGFGLLGACAMLFLTGAALACARAVVSSSEMTPLENVFQRAALEQGRQGSVDSEAVE